MNCPFCLADNSGGETCAECGHLLAGHPSLRRGSLVASRYEVLSPLGRGGMGMVYRAHDRLLDEVVALKVLRADMTEDPDISRRFRNEFKLARKVRHRNVCAIHEYGEDGGLRYMSMELIEGIDVKALLRQRPLDRDEIFAICIQAAEGLDAIHDAGIVHRDLKTSNIMRTARGSVRLVDFGIAKQMGADQSATATGQVLGTPEYISPEQARGERVDFRSDVYALGIVVFELFTGEPPFRAATPVATIFKHLQEPPPLDGPAGARLPAPLLPVLRRSLAKDPAERYESAAEVADALRAASAAGAGDTLPNLPAISRRTGVWEIPTARGLAGELRTMGLPDILVWLGSGRKTGTLKLERRSIQKKLLLREGRICSSWSNDPRESLGQFLIRDRLITEEQLFKALLKAEAQGKLLGAVLAGDGLLSEDALRRCLQAKAEATVYELFLWPEGRFEFKDGDLPAGTPTTLDLELIAVNREGQHRRDEWERIRRVIPSLQVTFQPAGEITLTDPLEQQIYALAADQRTPAEISMETRRSDFEVAVCLHRLCLHGALVVDQVADEVQAAETVGAIRDLLDIAAQRLQERRYDGAFDAYEAVLSLDRLNQQGKKGLIAVAEARDRERARRTIPLTKVPVMRMDLASLSREDFDPQEAFLLTRVNGQWDVQSMLKLCPISQEDALLTFARLLDRRVIELR